MSQVFTPLKERRLGKPMAPPSSRRALLKGGVALVAIANTALNAVEEEEKKS